MKMSSRILAVLLALLLAVGMPLTAVAGEYDLTDGDITVVAEETKQTVYQNSVFTEDSNPVITSNGETTSNVINLHSIGDATAKVTIEDVSISVGNRPAINVTENSNAEITVSGSNTITTSPGTFHDAIVHVSDQAELTLQGSGTDASLNISSDENQYGAAIGSYDGQDFTGTINIDNVDLTIEIAKDYYGYGYTSAIGSGADGDFSGTVNISDSTVQITNYGGSGIGAGPEGDLTGKINISGSEVDISSIDTSIGAGMAGSFTEGAEINIHDSKVTADSNEGFGVAIGTGVGADAFDGKVSITGDSEIYTDDPIGTWSDDMESTGTVTVGPNAKLYSYDGTTKRDWSDAVNGVELHVIPGRVEASAPNEGTFWKEILRQIEAANPGDTLTVEAGGICTIPYWVIDAAVERNVTLEIHWLCGEDFIIDHQPNTDGKKIWVYSFTTLPQLLAN